MASMLDNIILQVTRSLLFAIIFASQTATGLATKKNVTICLLADEATEMNLNCESGVIRILEAHYGRQDIPMDVTVCRYQTYDKCASSLLDTETGAKYELLNNCMGKPSCAMAMKSFPNRCDQKMNNYFQVLYECVPDDTDHSADICGESKSGLFFSTVGAGYIQSLNYPDIYSPDTTCRCRFEAPPGAHILLEVFDIDLNLSSAGNDDFLEYVTKEGDWGSGQALTTGSSSVKIEGPFVYVNFHSDGLVESRGFWLQYQARTSDNKTTKITVDCKDFKPSRYKSTTECMLDEEDTGELNLGCRALGIIQILYPFNGFTSNICNNTKECRTDLTDEHRQVLYDTCMGRTSCNVPIYKVPMAECAAQSNYQSVDYKCVPDTEDLWNVVDICGEGTRSIAFRRNKGYIETLNYPEAYSPDTRCQCSLSTGNETIKLVLTLLDVSYGFDQCEHDWMEYTTEDQPMGSGEKFCPGQEVGEAILTKSHQLKLNFHSNDDQTDGRGVWIKYSIETPSEEALVEVRCQSLKNPNVVDDKAAQGGDDRTTVNGINKAGERETSKDYKGLTIGLSVVGAIAIIVILLVVIYKLKRRKTEQDPHNSDAMQPSTPLDKSYNNLRKYAAMTNNKQPYSNLQNDNTPSPVLNRGQATGYHDEPVVRVIQPGNHNEFTNPTYNADPETYNPDDPAHDVTL